MNCEWDGILKIYENSKVKFKSHLKIHSNTWEGFYQNYKFKHLFKSFGFLQHCLLSGNDVIFRTRGPGSSRTFELHYLAIHRQVHSCSCPLTYFETTILKVVLYQLHWNGTKSCHLIIWHGGQWNHGKAHDQSIVRWRLHCTGKDI